MTCKKCTTRELLFLPTPPPQAETPPKELHFHKLCARLSHVFFKLRDAQKELNSKISSYTVSVRNYKQLNAQFTMPHDFFPSTREIIKKIDESKSSLEELYQVLMQRDPPTLSYEVQKIDWLSQQMFSDLAGYRGHALSQIPSKGGLNALSWEEKVSRPYQEMAVEMENVKIFKPEEVEKALETQKARAEAAYLENSALETQFPYHTFSYRTCEGTQLPTTEYLKQSQDTFFYKSYSNPEGTYKVGLSESQGYNSASEDALFSTTIEIKIPGVKEYSIPLLGVFDGHGGYQASSHVCRHLPKKLQETLEFFLQLEESEVLSDTVIYNALRSALVSLHQECPASEGTTANVSIIVNNHLYTANVGDSRAILVQPFDETKGLQLSEDAKPNNPRHQKIIETLGGTVGVKPGHTAYRINNKLAVGSSIGDHLCTGINPTVDITKTPLPAKGGKLVMACDGLWDVVTSKQVVDLLSDPALIDSKSDEDLAKDLVYSAWATGSADNISVIVVGIPPLTEREANL